MEGRLLNETELISRAKEGDLSAYEQLVRDHQGLALRVAYLVVREHSRAEDVVQEAFVKAHRSLGRFDGSKPFRPWILRIVRNEALNHLRGEGRREQVALRVAGQAMGDAAPSPETEALRREEQTRVLAALDLLPDRLRDVVSARFLLGLNETETAHLLRIPRGTVKSRTARGLERMRLELGDFDA